LLARARPSAQRTMAMFLGAVPAAIADQVVSTSSSAVLTDAATLVALDREHVELVGNVSENDGAFTWRGYYSAGAKAVSVSSKF
jgi:hypothetical protein